MRAFILAPLEDASAVRLACALQAGLGADAVVLVSAEELALAPGWHHRVDDQGASARVALASGLVIDPAPDDILIQRIRVLPAPHFARARAADRDYAAMELHALFLSWLAALPCRVWNPPSTRGLAGADRPLLEWLLLAERAGLPAAAYHFTTDSRRFPAGPPTPRRQVVELTEPVAAVETLIVAGTGIIGYVPPGLEQPCLRLSELAACPLLEIQLGATTHGWALIAANPVPEIPDRMAAGAIAASVTAGPRSRHDTQEAA